jgi:hypothetical protein
VEGEEEVHCEWVRCRGSRINYEEKEKEEEEEKEEEGQKINDRLYS